MDRFVAKLDSAGRVLLPAAVRRRLGLRPGGEVIVEADDERVVLLTRKAAVARAQEYFRRFRRGSELWSEELSRDRRKEATRESRR